MEQTTPALLYAIQCCTFIAFASFSAVELSRAGSWVPRHVLTPAGHFKLAAKIRARFTLSCFWPRVTTGR